MPWSTRTSLVLMALLLAVTCGCTRSPEAKKARYLERGDRYFKQEQYREAMIEYRNALRIDGSNAQAIRQLGLAYYQLGQMAQSFRFLLKAQEIEPDNTDIALKLATIYLLAEKPENARATADRILEKDPKNLEALILAGGAARTAAEVEAAIRRLEALKADFDGQARYHLALANLYGRKGDQVAAERAFQTAIARDPKSSGAHLQLAAFYAARRDIPGAEREFKAAAALAPAAPVNQMRLADFYLSVGRPEEAKRLLAEITGKMPDFLPAWRRQAEIALAEGRLDDAAKALDAVSKKDPADLDGRMLRGRLHLVRQESGAAIQEFRAVLKAEPRFAPGHYQLGLALLQSGDVQQARAELNEAVTLAPNFSEAVLTLTRLNLQSGAIQPAVEDLNRLITRQPQLVPAYVLLGGAYLSQQKPAQAGDVARKLTAAVPRDPRGPDILGMSLAMQGKRSEARQEFEKALSLEPGYLDGLTHLVALTVAEKQVDAAIDRVKKQIPLAPKSGGHEALLGELYLLKGDSKSAEAVLQRAIDLDPRLLGPYIMLGNIYARAGQFDQALARLDQAAKTNPRNPGPLMITGIIFETKGDIPRAREAYEKALAIDPRFVAAANNLAWIYSEYGGDKEKALQLAQTAKQGSPDDPRISDTLGWILYKRGIYQSALALLKESAAKLPDNPQVQYHLGMAYQQVGDMDAARKALQFAVASPVAFVGKEEAQKALANLK